MKAEKTSDTMHNTKIGVSLQYPQCVLHFHLPSGKRALKTCSDLGKPGCSFMVISEPSFSVFFWRIHKTRFLFFLDVRPSLTVSPNIVSLIVVFRSNSSSRPGALASGHATPRNSYGSKMEHQETGGFVKWATILRNFTEILGVHEF